MTREEMLRETFSKVIKINDFGERKTFIDFGYTGVPVDVMSVIIYPDGWDGMSSRNKSYLVYFGKGYGYRQKADYERLHEELDRLIEEKERTC